MKIINPDVVPLLEFKDIVAGECVAIGIIETGVLIHYMERDMAVILEWTDMVKVGLTAKVEVENGGDTKEIAGPVTPV